MISGIGLSKRKRRGDLAWTITDDNHRPASCPGPRAHHEFWLVKKSTAGWDENQSSRLAVTMRQVTNVASQPLPTTSQKVFLRNSRFIASFGGLHWRGSGWTPSFGLNSIKQVSGKQASYDLTSTWGLGIAGRGHAGWCFWKGGFLGI